MFTKVIHIWQLTTNNVNNYRVLIFENADCLPTGTPYSRASHPRNLTMERQDQGRRDKAMNGCISSLCQHPLSGPFVSSILLWSYHAIGYTQLFIAGLAERSCCLPYSQKITRPVQGRLIPQALDTWNWKFGFLVGAGSLCELSGCFRWGKPGLVRLELSALSSLVSALSSSAVRRPPNGWLLL